MDSIYNHEVSDHEFFPVYMGVSSIHIYFANPLNPSFLNIDFLLLPGGGDLNQ